MPVEKVSKIEDFEFRQRPMEHGRDVGDQLLDRQLSIIF